MKVGIFTPRSIEPLHPRLVLFKRFFDAQKVSVSFFNFNDKSRTKLSLKNWFTLWYFDWVAIQYCQSQIQEYDVIIVNDLKYLPLVKYARKKEKQVVYDTIDHNVHLRFYQLTKRFPFFKLLRFPLNELFKGIERNYALRYCDEIWVNSLALFNYFDKRATILYYSSPLESIKLNNDPNKLTSLIYLGAFTSDKGANEIIDLSTRFHWPLFIFGDVTESNLKNSISKKLIIKHFPKMSVDKLEENLLLLSNQYFLIGLSLIKPVHESYEVQEANKDIDYMALGIPFIGNYRTPTKTKIDAGCGWLIDDQNLEINLMDTEERKSKSAQCLKLYQQTYSQSIFKSILETRWKKLVNQGDKNK